MLSNSGFCCYSADTESDLNDSFDEEGLDLLDDTDWVDDTVRVLLLEHWPAVEALACRWSAGERVDAAETSAILRADCPPLWAETPPSDYPPAPPAPDSADGRTSLATGGCLDLSPPRAAAPATSEQRTPPRLAEPELRAGVSAARPPIHRGPSGRPVHPASTGR